MPNYFRVKGKIELQGGTIEVDRFDIKLGNIVEFTDGSKYMIVKRIERGYGACGLDDYVVHGNYSTLDKLKSVMPIKAVYDNAHVNLED